MQVNTAMRSLALDLVEYSAVGAMPEELEDILRAGWYTADCGALLLVATGYHAKSWPCDRKLIARQEYEVNDIRIPDLDFDEDRNRFLPEVVSRAVRFAIAAMRAAKGNEEADKLVATIGTGIDQDYLTHGTTVKFFTMRGDYPDWFDDLERFKSEAMMLLNMTDIESLDRRSADRIDGAPG